jgi:hypothetical protein
MTTTLRHRPPPKVTVSLDQTESAGARLLHTLEDFQSRIHYDPNDKPQIDEPLVNPDPNALLWTWNELPPWRQDNEYIRTGYRKYVSFCVIPRA